jgi:hypothetical protein
MAIDFVSVMLLHLDVKFVEMSLHQWSLTLAGVSEDTNEQF